MPTFPNHPLTEQEKAEVTEFGKLVEVHLANPQITLQEHRRSRIAALERTLAGRKIIYLDLKFWIYLRDPEDSPNPDTNREIRRLLYDGVAHGKLVCPLSYAIYVELISQPLAKRLETAKIMDDLSLGYCLSGPEDVYGIELSRFFIENASALRRFAYSIQPVWTKIGTLFGESYPPRGLISEDQELAADKAIFDRMWSATVTEMARIKKKPVTPSSVAYQINEERRQNPRGNQTFKSMYRDELHGMLDFNQHLIDASLRDVMGLVLNPGEIPSTSFTEQIPARVFINLIREATTRRDMGVPMQRTEAALYAFLRLDEGRPFQTNDANDIRHTAGALAYCDVFLTEKFFASLTVRKEIQKVAPMSCQVAWIPDDALSLIRAIS